MWSIWHNTIVVNERRARIALASISKQCVLCPPNTSESVKHKLWGCIQVRRSWRWATFIMHELCRVTTGNYEIGNKNFFGEMIPKKIVKKIKNWHLLHDIALWMNWIEHNDKVFNHRQWA